MALGYIHMFQRILDHYLRIARVRVEIQTIARFVIIRYYCSCLTTIVVKASTSMNELLIRAPIATYIPCSIVVS